MKRTAQIIHSMILEKERFLVVPHQNPDGDAIGSVSAVTEMLIQLKKNVTVFCSTAVPQQLTFLPHAHRITGDPQVLQDTYDAVIVCDSGDPEYAGIDKYINRHKNIPVINIDHHTSNKQYGTHNLVVPSASSTTEVLFNYLIVNDLPIQSSIATALLTGLVTDTGNFSNAGTSKHALHIASRLVTKGANLYDIRKYILTDKKLTIFKLWGLILQRLTKNPEHNIVYTYFTKQDMRECTVSEEELDGITNLMNNLEEGNATFVIREKEPGHYKISTRTTRNDFDLSILAQSFGGGGHRRAAGFTILARDITEVLEKIWSELKKTT